ncbi:MAG: hypothetical protein C4527_13000 [Candidatus Omnitrophota bacterium]|nr:MAG: hypothetical protein C4527_13000 [Candidatus Omnitrophota bacterium]
MPFQPFNSFGAGESAVLDISDHRELFVDQYLIDQMRGTELRLQKPIPAGVALRFDNAWEGRYCGYVTVLKDEEIYKMYYRGLPTAGKDGSDIETTCYAQSEDGVTWNKPNLGLFEVEGSKNNNVILRNMAPYSHNFSPFLDAKPDAPNEERFKALGGTGASGLVPFISADGIRWRKLREEPVITQGAFDSQNVSFWSQSENCYVCYFRTWTKGEYKGLRTISRTTSQNFTDWTDPVEMNFGEPLQEHLYTNQTFPYFRAPHIYIAIAARFMPGRRVLTPEQFKAFGGEATYSGDCSDTVLMTTRGGDHYDRTFMESFVRPGLGLQNWSSRTNYCAYGLVPTGEEEISFYIQRDYGQPTQYLERLTLRVDGFASIHAGYDGGELITKPFRFTGDALDINYSTSAAGSVQIEIQDRHGNPIPGFALSQADEMIGDQIERIVSWGGKFDVSALAVQPIRLRFVMKDADIFSVQFKAKTSN